ncbi:TetR family transcriptional regulator [Longimicrobium sp.]|uniref:TetR family transcriptional regulator n=1 Tax=Longimicrobium sp. TaxID=2029185 RepID=UPI002E347DAE|nr:TetR family transcriptional regulator [Longimicrobium sp.]HEX6038497.1 TetR family transcriptional regulator [Longimicrobium sp.]
MTEPGRREQKREETRRRLMGAAQRLFAEQGFDGTSVDEIAAAAGVSRRTFFHYFDSKEDVIFSRHAEFERTLLQALRDAPPAEPLLRVAEQAIAAALGSFDAEEARLIERLKRDTPALRERAHGKYERLERAIAGALAERAGTSADDLRARLDAMVVTGVLRVGAEGWLRASAAGEPIADYVRQVVSTLDAGLGVAPAHTSGSTD